MKLRKLTHRRKRYLEDIGYPDSDTILTNRIYALTKPVTLENYATLTRSTEYSISGKPGRSFGEINEYPFMMHYAELFSKAKEIRICTRFFNCRNQYCRTFPWFVFIDKVYYDRTYYQTTCQKIEIIEWIHSTTFFFSCWPQSEWSETNPPKIDDMLREYAENVGKNRFASKIQRLWLSKYLYAKAYKDWQEQLLPDKCRSSSPVPS